MGKLTMLNKYILIIWLMPCYLFAQTPKQIHVIVFAQPATDPIQESFHRWPPLPVLNQENSIQPCAESEALEELLAHLNEHGYAVLYHQCLLWDVKASKQTLTINTVHGFDAMIMAPESSVIENFLTLVQYNKPALLGTIIIDRTTVWRVTLDLIYRPMTSSRRTHIPLNLGQLNTRRKIHLGELNYFDHPLFGVLIEITEVPAPVKFSDNPLLEDNHLTDQKSA